MKTGFAIRYLLVVMLMHFASSALQAQLIDLEWVKTIGGTEHESVIKPAMDADGNVVIIGVFDKTVDFDPGPAVFNLSGAENTMYVAKYNPEGLLIWAKKIGHINSCLPNAAITDAAGNIYLSTVFGGTTDFDPGPAVYNLTSTGGNDMVIIKLNAAGNFLWAKHLTGEGNISGNDIESDVDGNLYITGGFSGNNADFDPGPGEYLLSGPLAPIQRGFLLKLDGNGNFQWIYSLSVPGDFFINALATDNERNVLIAGSFAGSVDFDPSTGTSIMTSNPNSYADMFFVKLNSAGNLIWCKKTSGRTASAMPFDMQTDAQNNVYIVGNFSAKVYSYDFDPGPGVFDIRSGNGALAAPFILKLNGAGAFVWAKHFEPLRGNGWYMQANSIAVDSDQYIFIGGAFTTVTDFDTGPGIKEISPVSGEDNFLAVLGTQGELVSVHTMGGNSQDAPGYVLVDSEKSVYFISNYESDAGFDPCHGITVTNKGKWDFFIAKYVRPQIDITASSASICTGTSVTFTAIVKNEGNTPTIKWMVNGVQVGSNNNSYTATTLSNNDVVSAILLRGTNCPVAITDTSNKIIMQVGTAVIPTVNISTPYNNTCTDMPVTFTSTVTNEGNSPQYQWMINGNITGTNEPSFTSTLLQNNDRVSLRLVSDAGCAIPSDVISNSISMQVSNPPLPTVTISYPPGSICSGQPVNFTATLQNAAPGTSYQWTLNGVNTGVNNSLYTLMNPVQNDVVRCIITTVRSCSPIAVQINSNEITLKVYPVPVVELTPASATLLISRSLQLSGKITGPYTNFTWQPVATLSNAGSLNPVATPLITTQYMLRVLTSDGCVVEKSADIKVVQQLFMPNSFTPNNDGRNDLFRIPPTSDITLQYLRVYNRMGNLIFHTNDVSKGWDGTQKGMPASEGNYVYMLKGVDHEGKAVWQQGNIILLR